MTESVILEKYVKERNMKKEEKYEKEQNMKNKRNIKRREI